MTDEYKKGYEAGQLKILNEVMDIYTKNNYPEYLEEDLYEYLFNNFMKRGIDI